MPKFLGFEIILCMDRVLLTISALKKFLVTESNRSCSAIASLLVLSVSLFVTEEKVSFSSLVEVSVSELSLVVSSDTVGEVVDIGDFPQAVIDIVIAIARTTDVTFVNNFFLILNRLSMTG